MKQNLVILFILFSVIFSINAQIASDPNDEIYSYIDLWEENGLVKGLPLLRPYSMQAIKAILNTVIESGNSLEQKTAQNYLDEISKPFSFDIGFYNETRTDFNSYYMQTGIDTKIIGSFSPIVTVSAQFGVYLLDNEHGNILPRWTQPKKDFLADWTSFEIGAKSFQVSQSLTSGASIGNDKVYFQAGFMRTSFGPFFDTGSIISPEAPHAGHFSFTYRGSKIVFTSLLLTLVASDSLGDDSWPDKYLSMHSFNFFPGPVVELGVFETVIYGERFDPMYLIPFSSFYYNQVFAGAHDNSMIGLIARFKLPQSINFNTTLFIDDIHFNDLIRFNFRTKYKVALQAGISWTPLYKTFRRVAFEYLLVTPYMYTHKNSNFPEPINDTKPNYLNYTHKGQNLGSSLEPNSDRFLLKAAFAFSPLVNIDVITSLIRHGNASTGITLGDGTIFDDGYDDAGSATFQGATRFLSQDVLEYTLQLGIDSEFQYEFKRVTLKWGLGYTLEAIFNKDLNEGDTDVNNLVSISFGVEF